MGDKGTGSGDEYKNGFLWVRPDARGGMGAKQQSVNEVTQNNCLKCWDGRLKEYIYI